MSYIAVTEPQSNPFAPLTSELVKQLRDNPIAIAQGLEDAPRIYLRAIEKLTAGNSVRLRGVPSFGLLQSGVIRFAAEIRNNDGLVSNYVVSRTRAGTKVDLVTWTTSSTSFVPFTIDISVVAGDLISSEFVGGSGTPAIQNIRALTGGQDLYPTSFMFGNIEGNRNAL